MGRDLRGVYHLLEDRIYVYHAGEKGRAGTTETIDGLASAAAGESSATAHRRSATRSSWCAGFARILVEEYLAGRQTPVFFGSAINNFGVTELLAAFVEYAPSPRRGPRPRARCTPRRSRSPASCSRSRRTWTRGTATASPSCASARALSEGHALLPRAPRKEMRVADALTFLAADRQHLDEAWRATSSACTTTAPSTSATPSPRVRS